jgi:hypothetical protein
VALAYHYDRAWYRSFDNFVLADSKWSPSDTNTELWYDASDLDSLVVSGTNLTQWMDKSGNDYHLTRDQNANNDAQSGVTSLRGRNVIEFGSGDSMTNKDWNHDQNATAIYIAFVWKAYTDSAQDWLLHHTDSTTQRQAVRRTVTNNIDWRGSSIDNTTQNFAIPNVPELQDNVSLFKINGSNSYLSTHNASGSQADTGDAGDRPFGHISVGSNENETGNLNGYIAEILYFTGASDVEKVEGYLAHKWGLSNNLPNDHLYKLLAP